MTDDDLYLRGMHTVVASWEAYARASRGAAIHRFPGGSAAVFPANPERRIYNNAILRPDLAPLERADAAAAIEAAYAAAGVSRFAVWVHENDEQGGADLESRGYAIADSTRAMGMKLDDLSVPHPDVELSPADWSENLRILGVRPDLLTKIDRSIFHLLIACLDGERVATAMALDHQGDCGIYNVATLTQARRQGLATALTSLHLHRAFERGCQTASLQSSAIAEGVYEAVGFRNLGRILEYSACFSTDDE